MWQVHMHINIIYENNVYYKKNIVVNLFCAVNSNSNPSQRAVLINSISIWWHIYKVSITKIHLPIISS